MSSASRLDAACDCIDLIEDSLKKSGNPTRLSLAFFLDGRPERAAIRAYVPEENQPRAASGRISRRVAPATLIAAYCPWCGVKYPEASDVAD